MTIQQYVGKWANMFNFDILDYILNKLAPLSSSPRLCPESTSVFDAFHYCPYDKCKVVFLGMDPYPQKGVATGIMFGNKPNTTNLSPSLKVIKKACGSEDFDITLHKWCDQGCLMLNSALTTMAGYPGTHSLLWRPFTKSFLTTYSIAEPGIIYVVMGSVAKSYVPYISKYNYVLTVEHPAYFARQNEDMPSEIFDKVNSLLIQKYNTKINW